MSKLAGTVLDGNAHGPWILSKELSLLVPGGGFGSLNG